MNGFIKKSVKTPESEKKKARMIKQNMDNQKKGINCIEIPQIKCNIDGRIEL